MIRISYKGATSNNKQQDYRMDTDSSNKFPLVCVDISGSTQGCLDYWRRVIEIVRKARSEYGASFPVYLWNDRVRTMDADDFLHDLTRLYARIDFMSTGGTSTATLCSTLLRLPTSYSRCKLALVTDGEVPYAEARLVNEMIRSRGSAAVPWDEVDAHIINDRDVDISVLMPFLHGHPYRATLVKGSDHVVRETRIRDTTVFIQGIRTIAEFEASYEELSARIVADTAFSCDPFARLALLELQKRMIDEMERKAAENAENAGNTAAEVSIDVDSVLAAGEAWYNANASNTLSGPPFLAKIQRMLALFTASTTAASNLSRQRFMQTEADANAVASQMPSSDTPEQQESETTAFEDPIMYDPQVPALVFKDEGPPVLSGLPEAFADQLKRNPFCALGSATFRQALLDKFDCVLGGETLRSMHRLNPYDLVSPMTRATILPHVMSLAYEDEMEEQEQQDFATRMRASLLAKVLFGGDRLYGSSGAWTVVVCHIVKEVACGRTHTEVSARAVERGLDCLVARVIRTSKAKLSLSGAGQHPTTPVPLGAAMLYCVKSVYMTPPQRNRMPEMLGAFEAFEAALALVGVDVSVDRPRIETLRWAARLIKDCVAEGGSSSESESLRRACVDVCAPYVQTIECGSGSGTGERILILLDAEKTGTYEASQTIGLIETMEMLTRFRLLATKGFSPAQHTIGKLDLNFNTNPGNSNNRGIRLLNLGEHYSEAENDTSKETTKVRVHPRTLRPYLMVPGGPDGALRPWTEAAEECAGPLRKQIPLHKLIVEYFVSHGAFPTPGDEAALTEFLAYASRASKCKRILGMAAPVPVLPANILRLARTVVEEVNEAMAERRMIYGDAACTPDRIRADILQGERTKDRVLLETQ